MLLAAYFTLAAPAALQTPSKVELIHSDGRWSLRRNGQPYFIRGAGGDHSLRELKLAGGNSTRTWGAEEIGDKLAQAQTLGMTVTGGMWLGHKRHGFDYGNADALAKQSDMVRSTILKHRSHPALLVWALGNEMEMDNDTPQLWKAVGELARLAKSLDRNHPVMTVVAEISAQKIKHIQTYAPDIDILGINSYGGLGSLAERLKKAGWTKPYVVTEFGPLGPWESPRTEWGAALEATSTDKARFYASNYAKSIDGQPGWCLGSYAFLWGHKQETTPTWFGMHLPSGESLGTVDVLVKEWTGQAPKNQAPRIDAFKFAAAGARAKIGLALEASVIAIDPDGDPLTYSWEVRPEVRQERATGEGEVRPQPLKGIFPAKQGSAVKFEIQEGGAFRLYVYVRDSKGKAATANAPFLLTGG